MTNANASEKIIVSAIESFNWHPAYEMPAGLRILYRAQYHINKGREVEATWN